MCLSEDHKTAESHVSGLGVGGGGRGAGVDECVGGNASQGLGGPLSLFSRLYKAQAK